VASIAETLTRALELHQSGRLAEAERHYREILQADPLQARPGSSWACCAANAAGMDLACEYLGRAAALDPADAILPQ